MRHARGGLGALTVGEAQRRLDEALLRFNEARAAQDPEESARASKALSDAQRDLGVALAAQDAQETAVRTAVAASIAPGIAGPAVLAAAAADPSHRLRRQVSAARAALAAEEAGDEAQARVILQRAGFREAGPGTAERVAETIASLVETAGPVAQRLLASRRADDRAFGEDLLAIHEDRRRSNPWLWLGIGAAVLVGGGILVYALGRS